MAKAGSLWTLVAFVSERRVVSSWWVPEWQEREAHTGAAGGREEVVESRWRSVLIVLLTH